MFHRLQDRILGDGVENDALDGLVLQHLLVAQHLQHMPGNGLSLAIRIGGEHDAVGVLDQGGDVRQALVRLAVHGPQHFEIIVGIDRAVLVHQIADMAERGDNLIILAEIFVDRLGLGRRFDDDDIHAMTSKAGKAGEKPLLARSQEQAGKWGSGAVLSNGP